MAAVTDRLTPEEEKLLEIHRDPVLFAQVYCDQFPREYQIPILRDKSRRIVLRCGRQVGKCVVGSTRLVDARTGRLVTVQEIFDMHPDERPPIFTLDARYRMVPTDSYAVEDNGVKETFRVTTKLGRTVELTGNHPLLTIKGWYPVENLRPGDRIAVPRSMPIEGDMEIDDAEIKVLAYIIGDGCVTSPAVKFSCASDAILADFSDACKAIGPVDVVHTSGYDYAARKRSGNGKFNPVTQLLKRHGVFGKSALEKCVPNIIFSLSRRQIALFLNRLFACDGWACVSNTSRPSGYPQIGYASSSEQLAKDVQHLLLRFGILANVTRKRVRYNGTYRTSWSVFINRKADIDTFAREIGIFSKEAAVEEARRVAESIDDLGNHDTIPREIWARIEELRQEKGLSKLQLAGAFSREDNRRIRTRYAPSRNKISAYAEILGDDELKDLADGDVFWDTIVSIESMGFNQTYDLSVPGSFNFVANDIFVHNTFTMSLFVLWFAYTHPGKYVLVAGPYDSHVEKIFSEIRRFINQSDILKASVVRDVRSPHSIEFGNGSKIKGFTSGAKSGSKGDSARGQSPDLIVLDEVDRMTDDDLDSIMATRFANPLSVRMLMASTPTGRRQKFYNWCVTAQGGHVKVPPGRYQNNGWTTYYYPSTVNPNWHIKDPETGMTPAEEIKASGELSEMGWVHEVEAEFGEEAVGVFRKGDIDKARVDYKYYDKSEAPKEYAKRVIGVDWDKYRDAGTNIVVTEYDEKIHKFKVVYREEIPRGEWTFDKAVNRIIKLNQLYRPEWIYIDRGSGEYQFEALRKRGKEAAQKHGEDHPDARLLHNVVGIQFSQKREVRDPANNVIEKKPVKSFMVNQTATLLERGRIAINDNDRDMIRQFTNYSVVRISGSGEPVFTSVDEHILDAFMLSILGFAEHFPELTLTMFKFKPATKIVGIPMARKIQTQQIIYADAPESVKNDPYELYDWKLKNNKRLVQRVLGQRFGGTYSGRTTIGSTSSRVF